MPAALALLAVLSAAPASSPPLRAGADVHVHLAMEDALPVFRGEVNGAHLATSPDQLLVNQVTTAQLERAGIRLVVAALWAWFDLRPGRDALDETLAQVEALHALARKNPELAVVSSSAEARRAMAADRIAVIPGIEGAEAIRRVEDVEVLYAAGVRVVGLVHFTDNGLADAQDGQFGPVLGWVLDGRDGSLTPLGKAAVRRMIALGMVIDLAHASPRTREAVLAITEAAGVPVLYSHAGPDLAQARTLDDAHAARIARGGGLVGVGIFRHDALQPVPEGERWAGYVPDSCDDVIAHWLHYGQVAGFEHVVLGSDLNSTIHRARPGGFCPDGLRHAGDLPGLFAGLEARGVPRARLEDQAERVLELIERVESARTATPLVPVAPAPRRALDAPM